MTQILFLCILYFLGLSIGLCFKNRIPLKFIIFSGFLWGTIIFSVSFCLLYCLGFTVTSNIFRIILFLLSLIAVLLFVIKGSKHLRSYEWIEIILFFFFFILFNSLFITFNFTLATLDSYSILRLGRAMALDGFDQNVINNFSAWGVFIPILQSSGVFLNYDYLVSLQTSFSFSFIFLFFIICEQACYEIVEIKFFSVLISILVVILLISTPMTIIQSFFIQGNLTSSIFLFLAIVSGWKGISENNGAWFVFLNLSLIGANISRSETFIYSLVILVVLLLTNKLVYKKRFVYLLPSILYQIIWFLFLLNNLRSDSNFLNPLRISLLTIALFLFVLVVALTKFKLISDTVFKFFDRYLLLVFVFLILIFFLIKPIQMQQCLTSFLGNMFLYGRWGISFGILLVMVSSILTEKSTFNETFFLKIFGSLVMTIFCYGFFRPRPFHSYWTDSANRLLFITLPIGLFLIGITLAKWFANMNSNETPKR